MSERVTTRSREEDDRATIIYIRGMDQLTTRQEVIETLAKEAGEDEMVNVGEIRATAKNISAVT